MKSRKFFVWLASAFVTIVTALVLAGCPHNGLITADSEGMGNSGGRTGNGKVSLVITNFTPEGNKEILSSSRTIAPEHIDLTVDEQKKDLIFVAYGVGSGSFGPEFIDINAEGIANLDVSGGGDWVFTVEAYDFNKLKVATQALANAGIQTPNLKTDITDTPENAKKIKESDDLRTAALVLAGDATVDLDSGAQVTLTLTNDPVTTPGGVNIAIHFKTDSDVTEIFGANSKWKVTAKLIDPVNQATVMGAGQQNKISTEVTLWDKTTAAGGGTNNTDEDIPQTAPYKYNKYDPTQTNKYKEETAFTEPDVTKALRYNPKNNTDPLQIPKGMYTLLVTATDETNPDKPETQYWMDPKFYVDGNRTTEGIAEITSFLGTPPTDIGGFDVYWTKPTSTDQLSGYDATFTWTASNYRAVGYEIELANITKWYEYDAQGQDMKLKAPFNNGQDVNFADVDTLWEELEKLTDATQPTKSEVITTLSWNDNFQTKHRDNPRWEKGNLLSGSTQITFRLETGDVYSARIRATNGSHSFSQWTKIGQLNPVGQAPAAPQGTLTKFEVPADKGIFDLVKIKYTLKDTEMYTLGGDRSTNPPPKLDTNGDTKVTDLLQFTEYTPGEPIPLMYGFDGANSDGKEVIDTAQLNAKFREEPWTKAQALIRKGATKNGATTNPEILTTWSGWKDVTPGATGESFGPAKTAQPAIDKKSAWTYAAFKDLELVPVGGDGSTIKTQTETSGTLNVLDITKNIGFSKEPIEANKTGTLLNGLSELQTQQNHQAGIYRKNIGGEERLVVVLAGSSENRFQQQNDATKLYVAIGDKEENGNSLTATVKDKNKNDVKVTNIVVTIEQNITEVKTSGATTEATEQVPAFTFFDGTGATSLQGMQSGDYTLRIVAKVGTSGQSVQMPVTIIYTNQPL